VAQFECGTRILRVIHGRDARATRSDAVQIVVNQYCDDGKFHWVMTEEALIYRII